MKTLSFTLSLLATAAAPAVFAQEHSTVSIQNNFTVKGRVLAKAEGPGLDLANVVLISSRNEKEQYFNYTNTDGSFSLDSVPGGDYKLVVYIVGYKNLEQQVHIDANGSNLKDLIMISEGTELEEFVVTDFKKVIEQRPDGINYNVENDKSAAGSSATDVLRKVPMVTVDMEGNVQLRGSGNIKVLIDGKPSELLASSVKDVLRQIPADNIKNIEVLTSPGAKYDGEGTSGVINIITKKKVVGGFSGSVFAGPSYNLDQNLVNGHIGTNLNYRKGKLGLNASVGVSRWSMVLDSDGTRTDAIPGQSQETVLKTNTHMLSGGNFGWSKVGMDYQIDSLQSFQASVNYNPGSWNQEMDLQSNYAALGRVFTRETDQKNPRHNYGVNAAYSKKSKKKQGRTFDLLTAYSINDGQAGYQTNQRNTATQALEYQEINDNHKKNDELTIQADYVEPLKKKGQKLEFGLKAINRDIKSDFVLSSRTNTNDAYIKDLRRSGALNYNQTVGGAYGQFTTPLSKKISMVAGARYEITRIFGDNFGNGGSFELPVFHNFLPNAVFMYDLGNFNKLKLSYNKRINRPSIDFVNPYIDYSDPMNLRQGNVNLDPERTHNMELGYSTYIKRSSVNVSLFHRITDNAIEQRTTVGGDGVSMSSYGNFAKASATGLDVFTNTTLMGKLMINLTGSIYYKDLKSPSLNVKNTGWEYSANMYANYTLNKKVSLNGFMMYSGNQVMLQGSQAGYYYYFTGVNLNILKGKGQLGLAAENFFTPKMRIPTNFVYANAKQTINTIYSGRGLRLSFNWNFGKMQFAQEKTIKNDDLKTSNGGQMGGGAGGR